jgi:regulator of RNase E activity RraA
MVGYAATHLFETRQPPRGKFQVPREDYWRYVQSAPKPTISVGQDIDPAPAGGSLWGEVQANIHRALGCVGVVLEGAVRDLEPLETMQYPVFAREVTVGHSWAHIIDFGLPVSVGDVLVHPGDLIHADRHGVLVIPYDAARNVAAACRTIVEVERPLIAVCQDKENFTLERLVRAYSVFSQTYPSARPQDP